MLWSGNNELSPADQLARVGAQPSLPGASGELGMRGVPAPPGCRHSKRASAWLQEPMLQVDENHPQPDRELPLVHLYKLPVSFCSLKGIAVEYIKHRKIFIITKNYCHPKVLYNGSPKTVWEREWNSSGSACAQPSLLGWGPCPEICSWLVRQGPRRTHRERSRLFPALMGLAPLKS